VLYKFLTANREKLLAMTREKSIANSGEKRTTRESEEGLPNFYEHLVHALKRESQGLAKSPESSPERKHGMQSTTAHGKELSRLGYTVSQVVHGYGGLCQSITEYAGNVKLEITPKEFSVLNLSLDVAIADAVTGFAKEEGSESVDSAKRMGFLIHELRTALAAVSLAHSLVKKGIVGTGSSTNAVLEQNLDRMRDILDRSFSELRLENDKTVDLKPVKLAKIVEEVQITAAEERRAKGLTFKTAVPSQLEVRADRHYLVSALANLVQNAIMYTRQGGTIWVRGRETDKHVILEVEDQCGGLPTGGADEILRNDARIKTHRGGSGLGLTISRRAVALNGGTLTVRDFPGKGCVFTISLPKKNSARPNIKKKRVARLG
jgi:signal transduction histidine kinase